jgi:hypothetical protein
MPIYNGGGGVAGITVEEDPTALKSAGGTMTGAIVFDALGGQNINKGTFDNSLGGYNGISLTCAVGYELNWQGGHLGNWYSGAYSEITIDSSVHITHVDGLTVESGMTVKGPMISDESATSGFTTTYSGALINMGTMYISQEETLVSGFNVQLPVGGSIIFGDSTTQTTAATYDAKKAIANLCAACFTSDGTHWGFGGMVAIALSINGKFSNGMGAGPYRLGYTYGSAINQFNLTSSSSQFADSGLSISQSWYSGDSIWYSDDSGTTWTQSDFTFQN